MFNRIFYDRSTGKILYQHFMEEPEVITDFAILEIHEGEINYNTHFIDSINSEGVPVVKAKELTPTEMENEKLKEDILLLQTDAQVGGIL
ncbi:MULTISPECIES: hypothetical protein [Lysinibacillus]|uniref:hypothetical protein n=1 Tax=Lysinibacillus TaxID=400634 RepID=UPI00214B9B57|nr:MULTISPECIES: hypothetical protein [Lysinibacillus]UUV23834.1 hypothetical protein NP781_18805 [Lysinibacillus sp. FN11]UUV25840.1 hypothetical protein NP781_04285 [Lysinibacillus sp. FN11]UYB46706.1 hypothetical protein OCI51_21415 [Lysinibacillus capsici]UYB48714.1 hypothetical protein OCI51_07080 [Lysinibacillus capsici]UYB50162.1 hypothetical protein OCI51_26890 [Lysinibacillus capsici]